MKKKSTKITLIFLFFLAGCDTGSLFVSGTGKAVIDGVDTPDELDFEINRLQKNAVGGQMVKILEEFDEKNQGCSGTLVGDRLVMTAAHCVIANQKAWLEEGAEPETVDPPKWFLAVGDDVNNPTCVFAAESVHLHPDLVPVEHDIALVVLAESAIETCPEAVPVQINTQEITDDFIGELFLQGGFGSLHENYNFSPIRQWSMIELKRQDETELYFTDAEQGFPTFGDSGSGALYKFDDGSIRNTGICSRGTLIGDMAFTRVDTQTPLFDQVVTTELLCGSVDEFGYCSDELFVFCDADKGFFVKNCQKEDCPKDCSCGCDADEQCDDSCVCDPDCQAQEEDSDTGSDLVQEDTGNESTDTQSTDTQSTNDVPQSDSSGSSGCSVILVGGPGGLFTSLLSLI